MMIKLMSRTMIMTMKLMLRTMIMVIMVMVMMMMVMVMVMMMPREGELPQGRPRGCLGRVLQQHRCS